MNDAHKTKLSIAQLKYLSQHSHQYMGRHHTEEGRRAILKGYGWKLIVIWGDELKQIPEAEIVKRIA